MKAELGTKAKRATRKIAWAVYGASHPLIGYTVFEAARDLVGHNVVVIFVVLGVYVAGIFCNVWEIDGEADVEYQRKVFDKARGTPAPADDVQ